MPEPTQKSFPLLHQFREFYGEVGRLKRMAEDPSLVSEDTSPISQLQYTLQPPIPIPPGTAASTGVEANAPEASVPADVSVGTDRTVGHVWFGMAQYLDQKMYEVNRASGSFSFEVQRELVYIMAALADEIFLNLNWSGRGYWLDHLMEQRLFHTQVAGQEIFRRITRILSRQDFAAEDLAAVYLVALALGFKGQYWHEQDQSTIDETRKKLLDRLLWANPDLQQGTSRMFPEAYENTVDEGAPVKLPEPRTWWIVVAGISAAWLTLSTIAWLWLTRFTRDNLGQTMESLAKALKRLEGTGNQSVPAKLPVEFWLAVTGVIAAWFVLSVIAWRQYAKSKRVSIQRTLTSLDDVRKHGQA